MKKENISLRLTPVWPALLSGLVAPGIGQIFNRDYAKGFFLLLSTIISFGWFSKALIEQLSSVLPGTPDQWAANKPALQEAIMKLIGQNSSMFFTFEILIFLIWGFSVADAYFTARKIARASSHDENTNAER